MSAVGSARIVLALLAAGTVAEAAVSAHKQQSLRVLGSFIDKRQRAHKDRLDRGLFEPTQVVTEYGTIVGIDDGSVKQFLGVPFAAPPVGDLRWKAPQPPAPWGVKNTTWFGAACPQTETYWGLLSGMDEDCLFLHIYAPSGNRTPPAGGYPIMLFWYGGSWEYGASGFPLYDADADVNMVEDVIIATSNYRLNGFGFLAGDELRAESPDGSCGNYGFQDQRAALKFMVDNAAAFGGDPRRVTIFGESAGAGSVSNHLASPRSWGLFSGAIIESGSFAGWTAQPYNISATRLGQLASNVGCTQPPGPARLACLRALPWKTVLDKVGDTTRGFLQWSPVIDGVEVLDDPRVLAAAGKLAPGVPVLLGSNFDEGTLFNDAPHDLNASGYPAAVAKVIGAALAPRIVAQYPPTLYPPTISASGPWWTLAHVLGDAQMTCAARQTARWLTGPNRTGPPQDAFVYFYTHVLELVAVADVADPLGCCHASELIMVWDFGLGLVGPGEPELAQVFVNYWSNFAVYGNPNGKGGTGYPVFPAYGGAAGDQVAQIDTSAAGVNVTAVQGLKSTECDFWDSVVIPASVIWGSP